MVHGLHRGLCMETMPEEAADLQSTLVRRGRTAETMRDMIEFVEGIEQRPLDKLLFDLPGLAGLSPRKIELSFQVVQRRMRALKPAEQARLRLLARQIAKESDAPAAEVICRIFGLPDA